MSHRAARTTVLIVDDEPDMAKTMARLIAGAGYRAIFAETYEAGRFAVETAFPDVILVDVRLGDHNGLQLIAVAPKDAAAIVMTGHDDVVIEREARRLGAGYLVKPVVRDVLCAGIERQLAVVNARAADEQTA